MPSNYNGFEVKVDAGDGLEHLVAGAVVKAWDITDADPVTGVGAVALPDVVADSGGHVPPGAFAIDAGSTVRFRWTRDVDGRCVSDVQVTT